MVESLEDLPDIGELVRALAGTAAPISGRTLMNLAWISVGALVLAVTLSCTTTINVGVLSLAMALIVGVFLGGMTPSAVLEGFPDRPAGHARRRDAAVRIAECNGTLARLTARAVRLCRGHAGVLPIMFFAIGFVVATIGAGATPASALLAPPAMAVAAPRGHPAAADGDHDRQRRAGGHAVAVRADRHRRARRDGAHRSRRRRVADVRLQRAGAHASSASAASCCSAAGSCFVAPRRHRVAGRRRRMPASMEPRHWLTTAGIAVLIVDGGRASA